MVAMDVKQMDCEWQLVFLFCLLFFLFFHIQNVCSNTLSQKPETKAIKRKTRLRRLNKKKGSVLQFHGEWILLCEEYRFILRQCKSPLL